jgi:23S rRNA pseudouridine2605 synthase
MSERLQKVLAQHGLGSRREIETWMRAGRVLLNGSPAAPGAPYSPGDRVRIDGRDVTARLTTQAESAVLIYNKAVGESLTPTPEQADTLLSRLPARRGSRWIAVNRMSSGDSGLLVLTNDGRLADVLMRLARSIPAVYMVRVHPIGPVPAPAELARVVEIDGVTVEFPAIEPAGGEGANQWYRVTASSSDRRAAVRALFESQGFSVARVIQVRYADVDLPRNLPRGRHRSLDRQSVDRLYERAGLERGPAEEAPKLRSGTARPRGPRKGASRHSTPGASRSKRPTGRGPKGR